MQFGVPIFNTTVWSEKSAIVSGSCWNVKLLVGAIWSREPVKSRPGDLEDEKQACGWDLYQEEKECGSGGVQGRSGMAGETTILRWRAASILRIEDRNKGNR
ncbi:hypothetical protein F3Y22_tig00116951pilonHSYRG00628 [Hibiscus syriacus]|uniref:Uncharacterized protein n=1 Tax=Hibiscus syriacus TaxID=106335 RepID=A0A6A2XWH9_HIBSY|nr:hypothetical protein F3Y22_tig00116951pilonHSYRG00628 [Hibiscus syriacus]